MEFVLSNLVSGYVDICNVVLRSGDKTTVRGMTTRELTGVTLYFGHAHGAMLPRGVNRGVSSKLAAVEALCMLAGTQRSNMIMAAAPTFTDVLVSGADYEDMQYGAYGPRIKEQLVQVIHQLKQDPTTRQAMLQIWRPSDLSHVGDKPCTIVQQFLIRQGTLELHTYMRSQDVWLGLATDCFVFTQLQESVARFLGLHVGKYVHHVGSFHAYERDFEKIENLSMLNVHDPATAALPHGVVIPDGMIQDRITPMEVAKMLLNVTDRSLALNTVAQLNPWYARQITAVHSKLNVTPL